MTSSAGIEYPKDVAKVVAPILAMASASVGTASSINRFGVWDWGFEFWSCMVVIELDDDAMRDAQKAKVKGRSNVYQKPIRVCIFKLKTRRKSRTYWLEYFKFQVLRQKQKSKYESSRLAST